MAGLHILPLLGACAVGSFLGGALSSKRNNTSYTLLGAACLQLLGVGLMSTLVEPDARVTAQYGFQVVFGLGVGLSFSAATIMTSIMAAERSELASAQGAVSQARVLGGCIGLSACTVIFNAHVNESLSSTLTPDQLEGLHRSPLSGLGLSAELREHIREVYARAFSEEVKVMTLVCVAMVVIALFTLERHPAPIERLTAGVKVEGGGEASRRASDSGTELTGMTRVDA